MNQFFTPDELAEILKVSVSTVRKALQSGELKAGKVGNQYRITEKQMLDWVNIEPESVLSVQEWHSSIEGMDFHCVCGKYPSGYWLALINWNVVAELSPSPNDKAYNSQKICKALRHSPSIGWLPQSEDGLKRIADAVADAVHSRIHGE